MTPNQTPELPTPKIESVAMKPPEGTPEELGRPAVSPAAQGVPAETQKLEQLPEEKQLDKEIPSELDNENCVTIKGKIIEIKPTRLAYFRNRTASAYGMLKAVPLTDFLAQDKGVFDKKRDSDQILFDFLIAVFDDAEFVKNNYDDITAADVDKLLKIFGRINGIDEREEQARKNREAQAKR